MVGDHKAFAKEIDGRAAKLFKAAPETMRAFRGLMESVGGDGALDSKTKELMALAVAIAVHCEGCINYHVREAIRKGATRAEIAETASVAIEMGGGPAAVYGAQALEAFDQLSA
ncbi:MAG: carboxymuconolactone decarboxylase family protein [Rhodospirillaceae bacterium]